MIYEYKTLGVSWELIASSLATACSVALDKEVCRGAIQNYKVRIDESVIIPTIMDIQIQRSAVQIVLGRYI